MEARQARSGSQAIERALAVLDCFAGSPALTLSEVAEQTGLAVSTTHRIMQALVRRGFLARCPGETYQVGPHVADLVPRPSIAEEAAPHLYALAAGIRITACLGVPEEGEVATLVSARPPVRYCAAQIPADREPMHATAMGKALLAFDPAGPVVAAARLDQLAPYTSQTRKTPSDLLADLSLTRRAGYAISDEERTRGVRGVAVPVFGRGGRLTGAIGVQARSQRMTDDLVHTLVPALRHFASKVGGRLSDDHLVAP